MPRIKTWKTLRGENIERLHPQPANGRAWGASDPSREFTAAVMMPIVVVVN